MSYLDEIQTFILDWNINNPIDHWWRTRYNVPFGSPSHLDMDQVDMRIAFEELAMFARIQEEREERREADENKLLGLANLSGKEIVTMSKEEIDEEFENLDLSQFVTLEPNGEENKNITG